MRRRPRAPAEPIDPASAAGRAEAAVAAAERGVEAALVDPAFRAQADGQLGAAIEALRQYIGSIESVQAKARGIELGAGRRDPEQAALARAANKEWKKAAVHLEGLGIRFRKADRRFTAPCRPVTFIDRFLDWAGIP